MQTVPSLVGSGTAIATAATGLVFGEAVSSDDFLAYSHNHYPPATALSTSEQYTDDRRTHYRTINIPSRPGTSVADPSPVTIGAHHNYAANATTAPHPPVVSRPPLSRYQRPKTSQRAHPQFPQRRPSSSILDEQPLSSPPAETPRASFSSSSSWVKRLSIRPTSQYGSPRSSVGPDSIAFSHTSGAPILSPRNPAVPPPTPNKLVKRSSSTDVVTNPAQSRPRAKSHLPSLRRPATSHQRSATIRRLRAPLDPDVPSGSHRDSWTEQTSPHPDGLLPSPLERQPEPRERSGWTSFFHARVNIPGRDTGRTFDLNSPGYPGSPAPPKRLQLFGRDHRQRAYLVKPAMVSPPTTTPTAEIYIPADIEEEPLDRPDRPTVPDSAADNITSSRVRARRSLSTSLSSASNWMARTSGSLRRPKRADSSRAGSSRHVSDPVTMSGFPADHSAHVTQRVATAPHGYPPERRSAAAAAAAAAPAAAVASSDAHSHLRQKHSSSPLRPLSGLSGFSGELSRPKSSGGVMTQTMRQHEPSGSSTSSTAVSQARTHRHERSSTMDGSESELRDFTSGDEDTDFKSDTLFDSLRTGGSGRVRAVETPLDSMYDESPPSTAGNTRAKRLSIQEILGKDWDRDHRILEEDESTQTSGHAVRNASMNSPTRLKVNPAAEPRISTESGFSGRGAGRFSMDDDFDDDWAQDEEDDVPGNALSVPSKNSSVNSRGVNPNIRLALTAASINSLNESAGDNRNERPLSNIFDWSEPPAHERQEPNGSSLRPKTAYANPELDSRGGRSAVRKGPTPTHVRSQSVPIVHEASDDESKPAGSKYGTWGMSTKTISEDWDDDFEFGGSIGNDDKADERLFAVPESIQASQPSVRAHSGQIRELSLLVNDLQRLCRHGRDLDLLDGPQEELWKEADGIIALASPDDDSLAGDHETTSSIDLDAFDAPDHLMDDDLDSASLDKLDAALDGREPALSKTAVVRDRPSPRRRSVFSPDDDIFGGVWPPSAPDDGVSTNARPSRPITPESRLSRSPDVNGVVRSVVEVMQHRSATESILSGNNAATKKMHFDTNSLRVLVKRAGDLRDALSEVVRRADQITQSPARTPRHERHQLESSPAFTKVFDDPGSSPPRRKLRSRGNTTMVDDASPGNSPSSGIARRMQMMTVK